MDKCFADGWSIEFIRNEGHMVSVWPHLTETLENFITMKNEDLLTHHANGTAISDWQNYYISDEFNWNTCQFRWDKVKRHYYDYIESKSIG